MSVKGEKALKSIRTHGNYIVFVTKEVKKAGWSDKTIVRVSLVKEGDKKQIVIEKGMDL